jgi:hypothetical protein
VSTSTRTKVTLVAVALVVVASTLGVIHRASAVVPSTNALMTARQRGARLIEATTARSLPTGEGPVVTVTPVAVWLDDFSVIALEGGAATAAELEPMSDGPVIRKLAAALARIPASTWDVSLDLDAPNAGEAFRPVRLVVDREADVALLTIVVRTLVRAGFDDVHLLFETGVVRLGTAAGRRAVTFLATDAGVSVMAGASAVGPGCSSVKPGAVAIPWTGGALDERAVDACLLGLGGHGDRSFDPRQAHVVDSGRVERDLRLAAALDGKVDSLTVSLLDIRASFDAAHRP